jgi:hypothetical protein
MSASEKLHQRVAVLGTVDPQSASAGTYDTDGVDLRLFRRALFLLLVGAIGASATVDAKLQGSADNSTFVDITGKAITQLTKAGTDDNKQVLLEISDAELADASSTYRYVRMRVTTATAASLIAVAALGGDPRYYPASDNDLASVDEIVG